MTHALTPPLRPEREYVLPAVTARDVQRSLPWATQLMQSDFFRRLLVVLACLLLWEVGARLHNNDLLLPSVRQTALALWDGMASGELLVKTRISLAILLQAYVGGVFVAFVLTALAVSTRTGRDVLATLTAMFNPLPAIALLPLALLWFGLGQGSLIFVLVHSVVWPMALNTFAGFQAVPETLRMTGRNYGLKGLPFVLQILVPAALPAILTGLKIGWAFAWRTLIAAELVFGASSGKGGLGWYIFQNRNELQTDRVFAGLVMVIAIGLLVEGLIFRTVERLTVRRWGMQR
ncbi:ABC transporter permease [Rhodoferax lacus]|uniref:ABC transporter permease n=1 Tax=Rhodoferax lacus TaxID=2184758 RepID=A0A3E1R8P5_9BURK|nr:ABC transporter permease [Rhodoferax lacus]RFO95591.1 ABC transporter permease [Rhodoferax lacus]